jgi:hypothetical protein
VGQYSSVGIATHYVLDGPGSKAGSGEIFRAPTERPWGLPSLFYNRYWVSLPGVKPSGRGVDHPFHSNTEGKKEDSYTSTPPLGLHVLFWSEIYVLRSGF